MTTLDKKEAAYGVSVPSGTPEGMYRYSVYRNYNDLTANGQLIFTGNFYYSGTGSTVLINIIDIIRNLKFTPPDIFDANTISAKLIQNFRIIAYFGDTQSTSSWYPVAMVYKYPHMTSINNPDSVYNVFGYGTAHTVPLQGIEYNGTEYRLIPHYPLKETYQYQFTQSFLTAIGTTTFSLEVSSPQVKGDLTTSIQSYSYASVLGRNSIRVSGLLSQDVIDVNYFADWNGLEKPIVVKQVTQQSGMNSTTIRFSTDVPIGLTINIYKPESYNSSISIYNTGNTDHDTMSRFYTCPLGDFVNWDYEVEGSELYGPDFWGDNDMVVTDTQNNRTIAILDNCYPRYYLMWQDRLGGWQSQSFNDKMTYSEDITSDETKDYGDERHKSRVTVQPKWKLNSNWITEEVYPMYESIFVSPVLVLYDAYEDKKYKVIVKGNFTEKKFKNEKKLLNLSLDLESTMQQNIIY